MQQRSRRWLPPWVPLGLLIGGGIVAVCLISPSGPEAQAAPLSPKGTAAFQTTEKLVVSIPLPDRTQGGTLTVELLRDRRSDPAASDDKSIHTLSVARSTR